jgi:hypothetical protein
MKKFLLIFALLGCSLAGNAQDIILKTNGQELHGLVLEISLDSVYWIPTDAVQGLQQGIAKSDVFMIKFANGTKEVFSESLPDNQALTQATISQEELYRLGQRDASVYYKGNGAMWGSAASSMVAFPFGLVGSIAIGASPAQIQQNRVSDVNLLTEQEYIRGYSEQANRKKRGKALAGVGIGVGVQLAAIMILLASIY